MRVTEDERAFLHELHAIKRDPVGKRIIHFHVSLAPETTEPAKKIESCKQFLKRSFAKSPYVRMYVLSNNDVVVAYSHVPVSEVLGACSKVEKLFLDDSVISARNAYGEYAFYKIADAVKELEKVFTAFKAVIASAQPEPEKFGRRPASVDDISLLVDKLKNVDIRNCVFNQPVYFVGEKVPSIEFLEFYVSRQMIEETFLPETDIAANPWLFNVLKADFDRAVIRVLSEEIKDYRHKSFSLNVTLPMVLSREFQEFHASLPSRLSDRIVVEIEKTDLMQHYGLYRELVAMAHDRGIRVCIDNVDWRDFDLLCLGRSKADFVKVLWNDDVLSAGEAGLSALVDAVKGCQGTEIVLSRCDNPKAFPIARALGIRYVQGRLADQYFRTGMEM